ncbi:MAG TPA: hydantoinase B/oxoprolinase family protein [Steroidobacteraceae bacterium]|nr:hydantoinase B/oxoprolinase family protein [Steroidobacteraceae bacterium]
MNSKPKGTAANLDPVTLEVIRNALPAITAEMSVDLQRTSYNMMIYEVQDYCTALLDPEGRLISQNIGGVSHFVADLGVVIRAGVARYGTNGFKSGDVLLHNHQATAGQHLNNVVIYVPVLIDATVVAFAVVRAHWVDVGGLSTGFGADQATDPWNEGLQFDNLKIYDADVPDEQLLRFIRDNIRFPDASMGDMRSQLAACRLGERRFLDLIARYGRDVVERTIKTIYAETEARCRLAVEKIPDGTYRAEAYIDGRKGQLGYDIKVEVTVRGSDMVIDLSNCSPQREGPMNGRTFAGAYIAYKALTAPLEPLNEGAFAALKVIIPEGNMMMAKFPALMAAWSGALPTVVDTIWHAFALAIPERIPAAHSGSLGAAFSFSGIDPVSHKRFVAMSIESGGWGGRPGEDGQDVSMSVCQGDVRNSPIETIELKTPVMVLERSLRCDSGGAGKFRGGLGIQTRARSLVAGRWATQNGAGGRLTCLPWGLWGGKPGRAAETLIKGADEAEFHVPAGTGASSAGTEILYRTAGGGGWGDPLEREPDAVLADVMEGYVSPQAARAEYGVVIEGTQVDRPATQRLRSQRKADQKGTQV